MLTTGVDAIDDSFKKQSSVKSVHKIIGEWNQNSYTPISYVGSYPITILATSSDPTYAKSFNSAQEAGGWDSGGNYLSVQNDTTLDGMLEDKELKKYRDLKDVVGTERPDPGIIHPFNYPNINNSTNNQVNLIDNATDARVYNLLGSSNRMYPTYEKSKTKYWYSARFCKKNVANSIARSFIGVSNDSGVMLGNNAFVKYSKDIITNKIVIKTQTNNGYPEDFSVEVLRSSAPATWVNIFTENSTKRTARAIAKTGTSASGATVITLSDSLNLFVGMFVTGTGVPANTKITEILPSSKISISKPVTSALSTTSLSFVDKPFEDGVLRITGKYVTNKMNWALAGGVEEENSITDLNVGMSPDVEQILGIRFSVQKLSKGNGTLDLLEISPRLVIDMSSYVTDFNINSTIGDSTLGLPAGSIVSSTGTLNLFNEDNLISNSNKNSILYGLIKPNIKFTILNKLESGNIIKYIPVKIMYSEAWDLSADWSSTASLLDYTKFWRNQAPPDMLLGSSDGIRGSAIIKILLDNVGFTKYGFNKTGDTESYLYEDKKLDFFYCDGTSSSSIMSVLEDIANSMQLSMFFDQYNNFVVMTKEAVAEKQADYDYWLVADESKIVNNALNGGDSEYPLIKGSYISNIETFDDKIIEPITSGEVQYSNLGIPKMSTYLLSESLRQNKDIASINKDNVKTILEAGFAELTLNREMSYVPQQIWMPDESNGGSEALLAAGVLKQDVSATRPKTILADTQFEAANRNDAIRSAFTYIKTQADLLSEDARLNVLNSIIIAIEEQDMTVAFSQKYSSHVFIDDELIKYNGILFNVSKTGFASQLKIFFSREELLSSQSQAPSGSSFIPLGLVVDLNMSIYSKPDLDNSLYKYVCVGDGRGQDDTKISLHYSGINSGTNGWFEFSTKMYDTTQNHTVATINLLTDTNIPSPTNPNAHTQVHAGYAKVVGPPSNSSDKIPTSASSSTINIANVGQQSISGVYKSFEFHPQRVGTRMAIRGNSGVGSAGKQTSTHIAGLGFYLGGSVALNSSRGIYETKGTTGYFLEVSTYSENYDASDPKQNNIKLYKVSGASREPVLLGYANAKVGTTSGINEMPSIEEVGNTVDSWINVLTADVIISGDSNTRYFKVCFEGQEYFTATDNSPLAPTNNVGMFVRDDSNAVYDFIYASALPAGKPQSISSPHFLPSPSFKFDQITQRRYFSMFATEILNQGISLYYEDFGNVVREAKKMEVRFKSPAFTVMLIELSRVNPNYMVKEFKSTSFGASFWMYNMSPKSIMIGNSSNYPVFISGVVLTELSKSKIDLGSYLENKDYDEVINDDFEINKRLYGDQSLNISGKFVIGKDYAESLAAWVAKNASKEKIEIKASVFPNPLFQLGDRVKVFYKDRGYSISQIGDRSYCLSEINYSANENGVTMNVGLREML